MMSRSPVCTVSLAISIALLLAPRSVWPQGGPLGPEFRVNTYTTNNQWNPSVAAVASGDFVVVWESDLQDGSGLGVFGQRYRPILPVELTRFRVE